MAKQRHLRNAPIVEALIDIRVRFEDGRAAQSFETFGKLVADRYPTAETRMTHSLAVLIEKNQPQTPVQESVVDGYMFRSAGNKEVVVSKPTGFSFSKLRPYSDWVSMLGEAWKLWLLYRDAFKPLGVVRIATRYINRLDFPGPAIDLDDYLTISPRLPPNGPQALASFATRTAVPFGSGTVAIIRCTDQVGAARPDAISVMLDLDIIREGAVDPSDDRAILGALEELRSIKNSIFFDSLSEKAVEVFA